MGKRESTKILVGSLAYRGIFKDIFPDDTRLILIRMLLLVPKIGVRVWSAPSVEFLKRGVSSKIQFESLVELFVLSHHACRLTDGIGMESRVYFRWLDRRPYRWICLPILEKKLDGCGLVRDIANKVLRVNLDHAKLNSYAEWKSLACFNSYGFQTLIRCSRYSNALTLVDITSFLQCISSLSKELSTSLDSATPFIERCTDGRRCPCDRLHDASLP
ncbi:hypothetical protein Tco_1134537 [Tanacetum coccineum]